LTKKTEPIYTIIVNTGTISSCSEVHMRLALIGDGASTLPFDFNSKDLFQSGSQNRLSISPFDTLDVGEVDKRFISFFCSFSKASN